MVQREDFLVEIGTEELPPKALLQLSEAFRDGIASGLDEVLLAHEGLSAFATPRRLAVLVRQLETAQADREAELRGPPLKVAYDSNGVATKAAEAFARKCAIEVSDLQQIKTNKGAWLVHRATQVGQPAAALLPEIVAQALEKLPIPRRMRWGSGEAEFVRPVHWVVMLLGGDVVPASILGLAADNKTYGHRFHAPGALILAKAGDYESRLRDEGLVLADFGLRAKQVHSEVVAAAHVQGGTPVGDEALFEEVTALVEWPVPVSASFDARFLALPEEVLIETLQAHQRYFPLRATTGQLLPRFITVSNIDSREPDQVRTGNERVVEPRLADAAFFYASDQRVPLADRVEKLRNVVFQKKLGTLYDKTLRVEAIAGWLAQQLGRDVDLARRAAHLAKCDLLTDMVGEFPGLQGTMGRYYALHDDEPDEVAAALQEQYLPRFAGDTLPATPTGQILAIAEKIDTIVGIFAIGQKPTGTRDPFALRRNALGVLRALIELQLDVNLIELIDQAASVLPVPTDRALRDDIYQYLIDRLRAYYLDGAYPGISSQMFDAVAARSPASPMDFHHRILAVREFASLDAAAALAAADKRIANILKGAKGAIPEAPVRSLLTEPAERELAQALSDVRDDVMPLLQQRRYNDAMTRLATLRPAVDQFFDDVMVMSDEQSVRDNRLALLQQLRELFLLTADLSRLQVG